MGDTDRNKTSFTLSIGAMAMLTVCSVFSLRNLPSMAEYGWNIIFFLVASAVCFFVPSALVSAELASTYPERGGVFVWVREAFGPKYGFLAIFMEWVQNLPWYPAAATFVATCLAYTFSPDLAHNRWYIFFTIIAILWIATVLNFRGMRLSVFLSKSGVLVGTIIPGFFLIAIASAYILTDKPIQIPFNGGAALIPDLSTPKQWMLLAGMMVSLAGMEMSSVHVTNMKNPTSAFPRAIFLASLIILFFSIFGALSVALVVPGTQLSMSAGVCQSFETMLKALGFSWFTPILAAFLAYGALASIVTWMNGPSRGLLEVAQEGYLPKYWQTRNSFGMQTSILILQTGCATFLALSVLVMPSVSDAFWLFLALCGELYMVMYLLMFAAAIRLKLRYPDKKGSYQVPGGKVGLCLMSGVAFVTCFISILCGLVPPEQILSKGVWASLGYILFLIAGLVIFISTPLYFFNQYQRQQKNSIETASKR